MLSDNVKTKYMRQSQKQTELLGKGRNTYKYGWEYFKTPDTQRHKMGWNIRPQTHEARSIYWIKEEDPVQKCIRHFVS